MQNTHTVIDQKILFPLLIFMANKNTWGAKKERPIRSSSYLIYTYTLYMQLKALISAKAKN